MNQQELFDHIVAAVAHPHTTVTEHNKRRAIQILLIIDDYLIDNLPGYCSDDCEIDFGALASDQLDILEGR